MKIVVLDGDVANQGDLDWGIFEELGAVKVYGSVAPQQTAACIGDAEVVLMNCVPLSAEVLKACGALRHIALLSTGYNLVDVEAAKQLGISVSNVPAYSTQGVAQHSIALLLEICNRIQHYNAVAHDGRWEKSGNWCYYDEPLTELYGKTMGIVGFGRIGKATGRIAKALGMRVVAAGSRPEPEGAEIAEYLPLEALWGQADVVSLHCPLTPQTKGIINAASIAKMKDGAILLNTARGGLVEEQSLADALQSGKLAAAGLDGVANEPISQSNPLLHAPNCLITPHIAWMAHETRARLFKMVFENVKAFLNGKPQNIVNP